MAADWLLDIATLNPSAGAGPLRWTVAVELTLPMTLEGLRVTLLSPIVSILRTWLSEVAPWVAVIFEVVFAVTADVRIWNVALNAPPETVTDCGTLAE